MHLKYISQEFNYSYIIVVVAAFFLLKDETIEQIFD